KPGCTFRGYRSGARRAPVGSSPRSWSSGQPPVAAGKLEPPFRPPLPAAGHSDVAALVRLRPGVRNGGACRRGLATTSADRGSTRGRTHPRRPDRSAVRGGARTEDATLDRGPAPRPGAQRHHRGAVADRGRGTALFRPGRIGHVRRPGRFVIVLRTSDVPPVAQV